MASLDAMPLEIVIEISTYLRGSFDGLWSLCQADPRLYRWYALRALQKPLKSFGADDLLRNDFPGEAERLVTTIFNVFKCGPHSTTKFHIAIWTLTSDIRKMEDEVLQSAHTNFYMAVKGLFVRNTGPSLHQSSTSSAYRFNGPRSPVTVMLEILSTMHLEEWSSRARFSTRERLRVRRALWRLAIYDHMCRVGRSQEIVLILDRLAPWEQHELISVHTILECEQKSEIRDTSGLSDLLFDWANELAYDDALLKSGRLRLDRVENETDEEVLRGVPDVDQDDRSDHDITMSPLRSERRGLLDWPPAAWGCIFRSYSMPLVWVKDSHTSTNTMLHTGLLLWDRLRLSSCGLLPPLQKDFGHGSSFAFTREDMMEEYLGRHGKRPLLRKNFLTLWSEASNYDLEYECDWREEIWTRLLRTDQT